jgi:hypothetical protein
MTPNAGGSQVEVTGHSAKFQAVTSEITIAATSIGVNTTVEGNSSVDETWAQLTEIEPLIETNEW